jgi:hypothetical protein
MHSETLPRVAHELNNPAAAISGIAGELMKDLTAITNLQDLLQCNIPADELQAIHEWWDKSKMSKMKQVSALEN